jgi:uncharacterized protein YjiS (DUF1127 family)
MPHRSIVGCVPRHVGYIHLMRKGQSHSGQVIARTKGNTMLNMIAQFRAAAEKRALYRRTRDEIAGMPRRVALDLGIFPEDAAMMARKAVWG